MSIETAKIVMERFATAKDDNVLVLKGPWGAGKTFAWRQIVEHAKLKLELPRYSYVSLFGISSLVDLRNAVIAKTQPKAQVGRKLDLKNINENWRELGEKSIRNAFGFLHASGLPYIRDLVSAGDAFAPFAIRDTLICFDDFERITTTNVKLEEVLGFASQLREERNCKIAFIFNEDELPDPKIYKKYREKLVDIELTYKPTSEEAAQIAVPSDLVSRDLVISRIKYLGITNIRILAKIVKNIRVVHDSVKSYHPNVFRAALPMVVLLTWVYYDESTDHPSIEYIRGWSAIAVADQGSDDHADWAALLQKYGLIGFDDFDDAILDFIKQGFIEDTSLLEVARRRHEKHKADDLTENFADAWTQFHGSFDDNEDEVVNRLINTFKPAVKEISPSNLNGLVLLLRELKRDADASDLIEFYVSSRINETKLFALEDSVFGPDVTDEEIKHAFDRVLGSRVTALTLLDTLKAMSKRRDWTREEMELLSSATVADFREIFVKCAGRELRNIVRTCLVFNVPPNAEISKRAKAALTELASESRINRARVRRLGVNVE